VIPRAGQLGGHQYRNLSGKGLIANKNNFMKKSKQKNNLITVVSIMAVISLLIYSGAPFSRALEGGEYTDIATSTDLTADPPPASSETFTTLSSDVITDENSVLTENLNSSATNTDYILPDLQTGTSTDATSTIPSSDETAVNTNTGADSTNVSETTSDNSTNIENINIATTTNDSYLRADTGKNKASFNTGSGIITTQNAKGTGEIVNIINLNNIKTSDPGLPSSISAENANTGADSNNLSKVNVNEQLTVHLSNNSKTINQVEAEVNSGQNDANYNTGHGIILTGSASLGLNFVTMANTNLVGAQKFYANWQNIYDNYNGNIDLTSEAAANLSPLSDMMIDASNKSTGADSTNQAIVNVNDQTNIITKNSGKINNEVNASVTSGKNKTNNNTGTGSVASGNVNSSVNVVNFLNSNVVSSNWWLKTLNVFGDWKGNIKLPKMPKPNLQQSQSTAQGVNTWTGVDSTNAANINVNDSTTIANANEAVIANNVSIKTNTGNNETSYNGGSGIVKFGEADAETNELNVANINVTGDSWWMVVINKFGNWVGTTVGSPSDLEVSGTGNTQVLTPLNSGIKVENSSTGPDSNNIAGADVNHTTDINNSNGADIYNNIKVDATSGENESQYNTGHGYIDTGDIRSASNIVNFANANITVGNWLVTVVNVFGNWEGNLIFDTTDAQILNQTGESGQSSNNGQLSNNQNTGAGSNNNASTNTTASNTASTTNSSDLANNASATSLSGENNANYNTGSGIVTTGAAGVNSNINNQINNNATTIGGNGTGTSTAINSGTGAGSNNDVTINNQTTNNIANNNNVNATNNYNASNTTGQNSSNYNTGNGVIDTGWAETYLGLYNQYNSNQVTLGQLAQDFNPGTTTLPTDNGGTGTATTTDNNGNSGGTNNGGGGGSGSSTSTGGGGGSSGSILKAMAQPDKGDLNSDGDINDLDFSIIMSNWGKSFKNKNADINNDSLVNDKDMAFVLANWHNHQ
jgi:hypothetical protein